MRDRRFRRLTAAGRAGLLLVMAACAQPSGTAATDTSEIPATVTPATARPTTTTAAVETPLTDAADPTSTTVFSTTGPVEAVCGSEAPILSENGLDTATPMSPEELAAHVATPDTTLPGFRSQTVVVDQGLGSFQVALPSSYSMMWRAGTPTFDLESLAGARDQAWTDHWMWAVADDDGQVRAISIDTAVDDEVIAVEVLLIGLSAFAGGGIADQIASAYTGEDFAIGEVCTVTLNGGEGAFVDLAVSPVPGGYPEAGRSHLQFYIPDVSNQVVWSVVCDVPTSHAARVRGVCTDIAASFRPLPAIQG